MVHVFACWLLKETSGIIIFSPSFRKPNCTESDVSGNLFEKKTRIYMLLTGKYDPAKLISQKVLIFLVKSIFSHKYSASFFGEGDPVLVFLTGVGGLHLVLELPFSEDG